MRQNRSKWERHSNLKFGLKVGNDFYKSVPCFRRNSEDPLSNLLLQRGCSLSKLYLKNTNVKILILKNDYSYIRIINPPLNWPK